MKDWIVEPSRFYIAPQLGDGLTEETIIKSKLHQYIDGTNGTFDELDNPVGRRSLSCVWTDEATHALIEADPDIDVVSEMFYGEEDKELKLNKSSKDVPDIDKKIEDAAVKASLKKDKFKAEDTMKIKYAKLIREYLDGQNPHWDSTYPVTFGGKWFLCR